MERGNRETQAACLESLVGRCTKIRHEERLGHSPLPGYGLPLPKFQFVPVRGLYDNVKTGYRESKILFNFNR